MSRPCDMDIQAFTEQLNIYMQSSETDEWAERICGLLSAYLSAVVLLTDENGQTISHKLPSDKAEESQDNGLFTLELPVLQRDTHVGKLTVTRHASDFAENERLAAAVSLSVCTALLRYRRENAVRERRRQTDAVKAALNTLSLSELEAAVQMLRSLNGAEGLLVTGRIADRLNMTRSVAVNALRKLESAGMLETRSMGMKGTYLRVHNQLLFDEIKKLKP